MHHMPSLFPRHPAMRLPGAVQSEYLKISGLSQNYGQINVLENIYFSLSPGEIVGLVGPNGAGKTTLMESILGLLPFSVGNISLLDRDLYHGLSTEIKQRIGVAPQFFTLPPSLTVVEIVEMYQVLYFKARPVQQLIEQVGLVDQSKVRFGRLSGGQKRRLALALALIGEPDIIFLDEPTGDLDPQSRRFIWDIILEHERQARRAVLIATHQMEEVEALCSRVIILDQGRIIENDRPQALIAKYCPDHCISFVTPKHMCDYLQAVVPEVQLVEIEGGACSYSARLLTKDVSFHLLRLAAAEKDHRGIIDQLQVAKSTLEDVFILLTGIDRKKIA